MSHPLLFPALIVLSLALALAQSPTAAKAASPAAHDDAAATFCQTLSRTLRTVRYEACMALKLKPSGAFSVEGRPLMMRLFPATEASEAPRRILFIGGIHGDELSAVSLTYLWMRVLNKRHRRPYGWLIVPVANPDGLFRRPACRTNARGVDLNRNFPSPDWLEKAHRWWEKRKRRNPRYYPGPEPASEPETRYLLRLIHHWRPDVIIALHAPFNLLDYDGPADMTPRRIGRLRLRQLGTYPGSLGRYAGEYLNIPVVTLELRNARRLPDETEMDAMWQDLHRWLNDIMSDLPRDPVVTP